VENVKDEVETIKQHFYKKQKSEFEEQKKIFVDNGGEEAEYVHVKDELENEAEEAV
jgi:hypothetical protein